MIPGNDILHHNYFYFLGNITASQLVLTSRGLVGITKDGKLFHLNYVGEQVSQIFSSKFHH